jgi:hypothetical protein
MSFFINLIILFYGYLPLKEYVFKGSSLTAADLGSFLNSAQLASCGKFKQEPKSAAVKGDAFR